MNRERMVERFRREAEAVVAQINRIAAALEAEGDMLDYRRLPMPHQLDEIEYFARGLTNDPVWQPMSPRDHHYLADVRCLISDAVFHARRFEYDQAAECAQTALRRLHRMRDRTRSGRYKDIPPDTQAALTDAGSVLVDVITLFIEAEQVAETRV